jgi:hypothetical protein
MRRWNELPRKYRPWLLMGSVVLLGYLALKPAEIVVDIRSIKVRGGLFQTRSIALTDLADVQLLLELPPVARRASGYAIAGRKRGSFELEGWGSVDLFLDRSEPPYLVLRDVAGAPTIITNSTDPDETRSDFQRLRHLVRAAPDRANQ